MVNRKMVLWLAGAILVAGIIVVFGMPGEEAKVKKQFSRLCDQINKEPGEGILDTAVKLRRTEELFASKCTVVMSEPWLNGDSDRSTLVAQGFQGRMQCPVMKLSFSDFKVSFPKPDLARCEVIARVTGIGPGGGAMDESREMTWGLRKIEGSWLFEEIAEVVVLKK